MSSNPAVTGLAGLALLLAAVVRHRRGLMLMRCYMTSVEFNPRGNEVSMEKIRSDADDDGESDEDDDD